MQAVLSRLRPAGVHAVRLDMLGRGFSLVKNPRLFDEALFLRLGKGRTRPLQFNALRKCPELARYGRWLRSLLTSALPEEPVLLAALEFRHEPAGTVDEEVDRLHADGYYIRSVYTPYGAPTIYREGKTERPVPAGQTLLMTALDRARVVRVPCTLHRRPGAGPERAVMVGSFEQIRDNASGRTVVAE